MQFQIPIANMETFMKLEKLKKGTFQNYLSFAIKFCIEFRDAQDLPHISKSDIKKYLIGVGDESAAQQKQSHAALVKFFKANGQPNKLRGIPYPAIDSKLPDIVDKEEILKRINAIRDVRYKAIFMLIYKTGLRVTECASLKLKDFNKARHTITVHEGKGGKDRNVPYGESVRKALIPYFAVRRKSLWLFPGEKSLNYISTSTIEKQCRKLLDMHPHQLRHCFAVHYLEAGGDIYALKEMLGHSKVETTEHYSRMTNTLLMNALKLIEGEQKKAA